MTEREDLAKQVGDQCMAVAHMAKAIAGVYKDYHSVIGSMESGSKISLPLEMIGQRTAYLMEVLGDVLNNMDAVTEDDEWMAPIFKRAQERWPPENLTNP